ncbi:hypothetical protein [Ruegeria atlantica]|uniref:hypothetical protein n=1 Tax=Ruegeria atlantica TaxID=81569 RepID=UPI0014811DF5|nr:hypothetical protein [Ruegeria atlantica]
MPQNRFDELMDFVCVRYGYCGGVVDGKPIHVAHFIPEYGNVAASEFSEWVMLAEDSGPDSNLGFRDQHKKDIEAAFIKIMGSAVVPAKELRWDAED